MEKCVETTFSCFSAVIAPKFSEVLDTSFSHTNLTLNPDASFEIFKIQNQNYCKWIVQEFAVVISNAKAAVCTVMLHRVGFVVLITFQ